MAKASTKKSQTLQDVKAALGFVRTSWQGCCIDYKNERLNSEACLQAAFYAHFRKASKDAFTVYAGVKARMPQEKSAPPDSKQKTCHVDVVVCSGKEVLLSVELKYTPRAKPGASGLKKDVKTLSQLRNQLVHQKRFSIEIERRTSESKPYTISPHARMTLGIFLNEGVREKFEDGFWEAHKPREAGERWAYPVGRIPPKLGICLAFAGEDNAAEARFVGEPFEANPA